MEKESGLKKGEREMIVATTSRLNQCLHCVVTHGAILRIREKNIFLPDQLATNYIKAYISARQKTMLGFAVKVSIESHNLNSSDFDKMKNHGFSDEDIWDTGSIAAFFALSNRIANLTNMIPNDEFYSIVRHPIN